MKINNSGLMGNALVVVANLINTLVEVKVKIEVLILFFKNNSFKIRTYSVPR